MSEERTKILQMVEAGQISAEEAAELLQWVPGSGVSGDEGQASPTPTASESDIPAIDYPPYWLYTVAAGTIIIVLGGAVVSSSGSQERVGVGTWLCGWIPLVLGMTLAVVGLWIRTAPWVHLRVRDHDHDLSFGLPLPLGFAASVLGVARQIIPGFRDTGIDEVILALREGFTGDQPMIIEVDDEDEGEHVRISFG